ncbi:MAG: hypothetical protein AAFX06_10940 [Planctomycetota bacterium]
MSEEDIREVVAILLRPRVPKPKDSGRITKLTRVRKLGPRASGVLRVIQGEKDREGTLEVAWVAVVERELQRAT